MEQPPRGCFFFHSFLSLVPDAAGKYHDIFMHLWQRNAGIRIFLLFLQRMRTFIRQHISVKLLLPLLFIAYAGSTSLFPHVHIIDGCKIVHSHPYSNGHTHSGKTAQTILFLSLFTLDTDIIQSGMPSVFLHLCRLLAAPSVPDAPVRFSIHSETRRGPPAIF